MAAGAKKDLNNSHPASPASGGSGGEDAGVAASASSPGSASAAAAVSAAHEILSASADDYFPAGCTVTCKTCAGKVLEGEVMAFDPATRILIMKTPSTSKRHSTHDVHFVNLALVSDVSLVSEAKPGSAAANAGSSSDPPALNLERLNARTRTNVQRKKRHLRAFKPGVAPEGQKLFQAIGKTLDDIDWKGDNIVVMNKVTITPPYRPDNVRGVSDSQAVLHIKKIVEKYHEDQRRLSEQHQQQASSSSPPSSSSATPSPSTATPPPHPPPENGPRGGRGDREGGRGGRQRNSPITRGGGSNASPKPT